MKNKRIGIGKYSLRVGWFDAILYTGLFALFLNMAFIRNFKGGEIACRGEFYSDNAAYYIYLPATFIHGYTTESYPDSIDYKNAGGFMLNKKENKVITKVTYGVAFLVAPFFVPAQYIISACGWQADGFSIHYHRLVVVAAIFYLILAMFILKSFLLFYFPRWLSYSLPFIILVGSNLYFFSMEEALYAHLYSFFLISLMLLTLKKYLASGMKSFGLFVALGFIMGFLVLVRPTNLLLLSLFAFWDVTSLKEIGNRFVHFFRWKYILTFIVIALLVFIPQSVYWHYISGSWIYFSYPGEGFTSWKHPMLIPFWFSPLNGWIPYTPLAILFLIGFGTMIVKRYPNGILITLLFLVYSYSFASWHSWYFGGSFGCRPLIDFYPLFAVALGYLLMTCIRHKNLLVRVLPLLFILFSIYFNQRLFDRRRWYTGGTWSWEEYKDQLEQAKVAYFPNSEYIYRNDFENTATSRQFPVSHTRFHSETKATYITKEREEGCHYNQWLFSVLDGKTIEKVSASVWINTLDSAHTGAIWVCDIRGMDNQVKLKREISLDELVSGPNQWTELTINLHIPPWIDTYNLISFYFLNSGKANFYIDDLVIRYE